jgi:hypothetical protein
MLRPGVGDPGAEGPVRSIEPESWTWNTYRVSPRRAAVLMPEDRLGASQRWMRKIAAGQHRATWRREPCVGWG